MSHFHQRRDQTSMHKIPSILLIKKTGALRTRTPVYQSTACSIKAEEDFRYCFTTRRISTPAGVVMRKVYIPVA